MSPASWLPAWGLPGVVAPILLALIVSFVIVVGKSRTFVSELTGAAATKKQLLMVIAHPDDESMFFLPLLLNLRASATFHLLCLSTGNYDGLGSIRNEELATVWASLHMRPDTLTTLDDSRFQDGMKAVWAPDDVAAVVATYVKDRGIDTIFTFDDYGVSGHPNHISVHHGVRQTLASGRLPSSVGVYQLESTPLWRKYIGALDVIFTASSSAVQFVSLTPWESYNAMALHYSQFVWFRRLFVVFSRYTYVNTFTRLRPSDKKTE